MTLLAGPVKNLCQSPNKQCQNAERISRTKHYKLLWWQLFPLKTNYEDNIMYSNAKYKLKELLLIWNRQETMQ